MPLDLPEPLMLLKPGANCQFANQNDERLQGGFNTLATNANRAQVEGMTHGSAPPNPPSVS